MAPLRILVNGAGVCGPALACFLIHSTTLNCAITILERSPELRTGGQQIDLRDQGIPLLQRLGVLETIRTRTVPETGIVFVNSRGVKQASFGVKNSGSGPQSFVSEFEILRGDLVKVLYDASIQMAQERGKSLTYEFGKYVTAIDQGDGNNDGTNNSPVVVTLSDGTRGEYDLIVGADGQGSKTRRLILPPAVNEAAFDSKGVNMCLFMMPKSVEDEKDNHCVVYQVPKRRVLAIRTAAEPGTQVILGIMGHIDTLRAAAKLPIDEQKRTWEALFTGAGWETDRLLKGMWQAEDFWAAEIAQIKTPQWSKGRVVLLGDAGYCPSPITGLGTTLSIMGAYVLAGELSKHMTDREGATHENIRAAFAGYDSALRPFVNSAQKLPPGVPDLLYPVSAWGITLTNWFLWAVCLLKIDRLFSVLNPGTSTTIQIPQYLTLDLPGDKTKA